MYDPPGGTVFVDGIDVLDLPLEDLRSLIGFVPQEPFLFSQTVAENIAFGLRSRRQSVSTTCSTHPRPWSGRRFLWRGPKRRAAA